MTTKKAANSLDATLLKVREGGAAPGALPERPQDADELAPLLAAAERVRRLHAYRLPEARRQQAKARLRAAWIAQEAANNKAPWWRAWLTPTAGWPRIRGGVLAALLALILLIPLTVTAIAASEPGDLAYPARVALEQVPARLQSQPESRANAELKLAERRLTDLDTHLARTGQLATAAVDALLENNAAAVAAASKLTEDEQRQVAARVDDYAVSLARLAESTADPAAQAALRAASAQAAQLSAGLARPAPKLTPPVEHPTAIVLTTAETPIQGLTPQMVATPEQPLPDPTLRPTHTVGPLPSFTPGRTPLAVPGLRATARAASPVPPATHWPTATLLPKPVNTPVPGLRATALATTAATPPFQPPATVPAPGPGPGARATALAQTATPDVSFTPPLAETPVAGRRATALAQTATPTVEPLATETPTPEAAP